MAYRLNVSNVCFFAKTLQQAGETIKESSSVLLRPTSKNFRYFRDYHGNKYRETSIERASPNEVRKGSSTFEIPNKHSRNKEVSHVLQRRSEYFSNEIDGTKLNNPKTNSDQPERSYKCCCPSYSEILTEKIKRKGNYIGSLDKREVELRLLSSKASETKLFGSKFNIPPLVGSQYLRGHFVNLRSICGVIRSNQKSSRISIRKSTKMKKRLPKLFLDKCNKIQFIVPPLRDVPLKPLIKKYNPEEPRKCPEQKQKEPCERADDDWKLEAKPFSVISYSARTFTEFKMKPSKPIKRLEKFDIMEPPKKCEVEISKCQPRSDMNLDIVKKKLPNIPCGEIRPKFQKFDAKPLRRLRKISVPDPPRICPQEIIERAQCTTPRVDKKTLPPLCSSPVGAPIPFILKNNAPLKRLLPAKVEEPPRCSGKKDDKKQCRLVENVKKKKLPNLQICEEERHLPSPTFKPMKKNSLKPPMKTYEPEEPLKICPKTAEKPICRKDIVVPKKSLPKIPATSRALACYPLKDGKSLKRLQKVLITEPPKICPSKVSPKTCRRADDERYVAKRPLPIMKCDHIPKTTPAITKPPPLKRLPKYVVEEPSRICPVENIDECPDRLIESIEKRKLPVLDYSGKTRGKFVEMKNSPSLKRLPPLEIKEDIRECKEKEIAPKECFRSDSADWSFPGDSPLRNTVHQINSTNVSGRRSMSTNLTHHYTKGLLIRKMQMSHIDVRKRFSLSSIGEECQAALVSRTKSDLNARRSSDDASMKDLQPKNPMYTKFHGVAPNKPEAPPLDPEKEDDCIRKKFNIPEPDLTASCDNLHPKRKYLRVTNEQSEQCPPRQAAECSNIAMNATSPPPHTSSLRPPSASHAPPITSSSSTRCPPYFSPAPPTNAVQCPSSFAPSPPASQPVCPPSYSPDPPNNSSSCPPTLSECATTRSATCPPSLSSCQSSRSSTCSASFSPSPPDNPPPVHPGTPPSLSYCPPTPPPTHACPPCPCPCPPNKSRKPPYKFRNPCEKLSLWQRLKNYFKARPNCPTPAQLKKKKMMKKITKMADKAGLGVYDPCDDPGSICREVERRCCLARKCSCSNKRCYHCYSSSSRFELLWCHHQSIGLSNKLLLINNYTFFIRTLKDWKNPFEFYEIEYGENAIQETLRNKYTKEELDPDDIVSIVNTLQSIDQDLLSETMYRCLKLKSGTVGDSFRNHVNYILEFSPECLEEKRDILREILNAISHQICVKKHAEEIDANDSTPDILVKLVNKKNRG